MNSSKKSNGNWKNVWSFWIPTRPRSGPQTYSGRKQADLFEISAIDLALSTITELSSSIHDSFGLYLNQTASQLICGITGGIYTSISVDEHLNVFLNTRTRLIPIDQVSSGTMDQVYLALRLAAAKLMQPDGEPMPLIFDDSFLLYDDDRLATALKWLSTAYEGQDFNVLPAIKEKHR